MALAFSHCPQDTAFARGLRPLNRLDKERERVKGLMKITTWPSGSHEQNGGQRSKNPSYGMLPCPAI